MYTPNSQQQSRQICIEYVQLYPINKFQGSKCLNPESQPRPPSFITILTLPISRHFKIFQGPQQGPSRAPAGPQQGPSCLWHGDMAPRQMFDVAIQAVVGGKVVAKVRVVGQGVRGGS